MNFEFPGNLLVEMGLGVPVPLLGTSVFYHPGGAG
jgi:hypothetical protein